VKIKSNKSLQIYQKNVWRKAAGGPLLVINRKKGGNAASSLPALPAANRVLGRRLHAVWGDLQQL